MTRDEWRRACEVELDKPYVWGGEGPDAYDCSGFVQFGQVELDPPVVQTAAGLHRFFSKGRASEVGAADAELGDLVFFGKDDVTHVALAWGGGDMLEAGGGGSRTTSIAIARRQGAKVRIRPIASRTDPVRRAAAERSRLNGRRGGRRGCVAGDDGRLGALRTLATGFGMARRRQDHAADPAVRLRPAEWRLLAGAGGCHCRWRVHSSRLLDVDRWTAGGPISLRVDRPRLLLRSADSTMAAHPSRLLRGNDVQWRQPSALPVEAFDLASFQEDASRNGPIIRIWSGSSRSPTRGAAATWPSAMLQC